MQRYARMISRVDDIKKGPVGDNDRKCFTMSCKGRRSQILTVIGPEIKAYFRLFWGLPFPIWVGYFQANSSSHMKNYLSILRGKAGQILILLIYK